ncbi:MAG: UDP-N-acetylmuramoyl-L-alanine--D-glutamate ligase [Armatimonadetes bacterium]|nr:UDP-N-acetylmuramoyl-L-alanine--D-glutamate ligase [Armatimonadota bacterium]
MRQRPCNPRVAEPVAVEGRSVVVVGAGRSGLGAAKLLTALGASVVVVDSRPAEEIEHAEELRQLGAELVGGCRHLPSLPGIRLAVVSPGVPPHAPIIEDIRRHGIPTVGELEVAWQFCPARVIAITGTNGKGTTCRLCTNMLAASGIPVELAGNIGRPLSDCVSALTSEHVVVVEVSSFQLAGCSTFAPHVACLLNIAVDHLDWHATFEDYRAAKRRIFANQRPEDIAIIVVDDPGAASVVPDVRAQLAKVSLGGGGDVYYSYGRIYLSLPFGRSCVEAPELGQWPPHLLTDALVAAAAACSAGATSDAVARAIAAYEQPPHLMQHIADLGAVRFIDDSKATNVAAAVADLRGLAACGRVIVITGGKDKGIDLRPWAQALEEMAAGVVLIGETGQQLAGLIRGHSPQRAASMEEAVGMAYSMARPGDIVALVPAASSFDMFTDYADRGEKFAQAVRALIAAGAS